jgi:RHS repeat-associated protein
MTQPIACLFSAASVSRSIFTGKERDAESGNDYFGARYYASTMGRFLSPDWSAKAEPVPYANLEDPQSLNLYAYVRNNPLVRTDPDGHFCQMRDVNPLDSTGCGLQPIVAAPKLPNGQPAPPAVPIPGHPELKWEWHPDANNSRSGTWGPAKGTWDGKNWGSPPSASWDDKPGQNGIEHWDVKDGSGNTKRYDKDGNYLTPKQAHGRFDLDTSLVPKPESFGSQLNELNRFIHDLVEYAIHFHQSPGYTPGTIPPPPGGYIPSIPPTVFAIP